MKCFGEKLLFLLLLMATTHSLAVSITPVLPNEGVVDADNNSFIDPNVDYSVFFGRVTDKDKTGRILKVRSENNNTKFLKAGDIVYFKVNEHDYGKYCKASVRSVEDFFFSMFVQDFSACWDMKQYFPRGQMLNFTSKLMEQRVFEASHFREILLLRKEGYISQLSKINHFLWTYDQQKIKVAAEYDERINEILREKQKALDNLIQKKQENILLQSELKGRLTSLDESLNHYKIERQEPITDRWNMDHGTNLPFGRRPMEMKVK